MRIYKLTHVFQQRDGETLADPKDLGYYTSMEQVQAAKDHYLRQMGFREHPRGFLITPCPLREPIRDDFVYEALVYFRTADYETEYTVPLGVWGSREAAEQEIQAFLDSNPDLMHCGVPFETILNRTLLDNFSTHWPYGFVNDREPEEA